MEFAKTIGHEKQKNLFARAIGAGTLSHAYAFVGPEWIGKTTFARELAGHLSASEVLNTFICDSEDGMDIEQARAMSGRLGLTASGGGIKTAIVSYAERMTLEAANSLLKLLEDPPRNSLICLITTNYFELLPTIASRVQRINFSKVGDEDMRKGLLDLNLTPVKLEEIVKMSGGRLGLAKTLAASEDEYNFLKSAVEDFEIMQRGTILERFKRSQETADWDTPKIKKFIKFMMELWVEKVSEKKLGDKISQAYHDLDANVNTKLLMDNLFLP